MTAADVEDWDSRVQQVWASAATRTDSEVLQALEHLAAERPPHDPAALFERASARDYAGHEADAEAVYRKALEAGLAGDRRAQAVIQLASTLRLLGRPGEAVDLLERESATHARDDLDGARAAFLALALADAGQERRALATALTALADHLPRYQRAVRHYAQHPHPEVDEDPAAASAPAPAREGTQARYRVLVGEGDPDLDQRLSAELDTHNTAATPGVDPARELTVQVLDDAGDLVAGLSGWTWGVAAGIAMTWVHPGARGAGHGARLLSEFEEAARARGCTHVFTTSFTFQAPDFYRRAGYRDLFRWDGLPTPGAADIHLRKDLTRR